MKLFKSILILLFFITSNIYSETRLYRYYGPINKFLVQFVDELGNKNLKFQITKHYNEEVDGRLGFSMLVLPGRKFVDLQFFNENNQTTLVKIFYENAWDGRIFHEIFMKLKMNEPEVKAIDDSLPPGWPKP